MTNALPKEALQAEQGRFRDRFLLVGALVFLGTAAISALALLPSHVALHVENKNLEQQSINDSGTIPNPNSEKKSERSDVIRAQALLENVEPFVSATSSPSEAISAALVLRPVGVRVDHISFESAEKGTIAIYGISQGREGISQYREALSNSGRFKSVSVPVGALVGMEGGKFTITLSGIL